MIFLVENQIPFEKSKNSQYRHRLAYSEASAIYSSLYGLKFEVLKLIEEIAFLVEGSGDLDDYKSGFGTYSADLRDYHNENALIIEIMNCFPASDELLDKNKRNFIENLIRNIDVISLENAKRKSKILDEFIKSNEHLLFCIPFIKESSNHIIINKPNKYCSLFTNGRTAKLINEDQIYFISSEKYKYFQSNLEKLQLEFNNKTEDISVAFNYRNKDILELFDNGFSKKFLHILKEGRKRIMITGEEVYFSKKAIEKLLAGRDRYYFYMPRDLVRLEEVNQSLAVFNIDDIADPTGYNKLYKTVNTLSSSNYVLLQAVKKVISQYFEFYDDLHTPGKEELCEKIIEIFIYLLLERNSYEDNHIRLFTLIGSTQFKELIPAFGNVDILSKSVSEFHSISFKDLTSNISFWVCLDNIVENLLYDRGENDSTEPKPKVLFAHLGQNWVITGYDRPMTFDYASHKGLLYLAVILKSGTELTASQVKEIAYRSISEKKYNEKLRSDKLAKKNVFDIVETDRKTISSAINQIKTNKQLKTFIEKYVKFGARVNSFASKNEITVEVDDPNILDSYFP